MPDALDVILGFSGKIPARGDFVRSGLPRDFLDPWHDWQSVVIAGSRNLMGEAWLDAFLEAPVWRFVLPPGLCGARAAVGWCCPAWTRSDGISR
jgi:type VI secretion system protein ImpM